MKMPYDEKKAKDLLSSRGYVVVQPKIVAKDPPQTQIDLVVGVIGSRNLIADILGLTRAAVHSWDKRGIMPTEHADELLKWSSKKAPEYHDELDAILSRGV